jgi:selenocysteine lyase/cysteine desulfurase
MPALANKSYFNYGGQGPLPDPSLEAITASWRRIQELGPFTTAVWPFVEAQVAAVRNRLAAACGVAPIASPSLKMSPVAACYPSGVCSGKPAMGC